MSSQRFLTLSQDARGDNNKCKILKRNFPDDLAFQGDNCNTKEVFAKAKRIKSTG